MSSPRSSSDDDDEDDEEDQENQNMIDAEEEGSPFKIPMQVEEGKEKNVGKFDGEDNLI